MEYNMQLKVQNIYKGISRINNIERWGLTLHNIFLENENNQNFFAYMSISKLWIVLTQFLSYRETSLLKKNDLKV